MEIIKYPEYTDWKNISKRATMDVSTLFDTVRQVLDDVRLNGDAAIRKYEKQFDKVDLTDLLVSEEEIAEAENLVSDDLKQAIRTAKKNIETFHASQRFEGKRFRQLRELSAGRKPFQSKRLVYIFLVERLHCSQPC